MSQTGPNGRRTGTRRELMVSISIAVLVFLLVALGASFAARFVSQRQSLDESERRTVRLADTEKERLELFLADPVGAKADLAADIEFRVSPEDLTEFTVWDPAGTVLFSSNDDDIGKTAEVSPEMAEAVRDHKTVSGFENEEPEADRAAGESATVDEEGSRVRYVEVYVPLRVDSPEHPVVVVETYYNYERVERLTHGLFVVLLPLVLLPLLILQAIQLPVALSLARRVRRHEREHTALLEEALDVSDRQRVRFAADLHDGPIQDLAGIGYALGMITPTVPEQHQTLMVRVEDALQRAIHSLRGLMTDLYPPDLRTGTLEQAVESLAAPLRTEGVAVVIALETVPALSEETVGALYRVAREALANVGKHADPTSVRVDLTLMPATRGGADQVRLNIADDGVGVDPTQIDRRAEGHLGLRLITDRVAALGGRLTIESAPGEGTTVTVVVPVVAPVLRTSR